MHLLLRLARAFNAIGQREKSLQCLDEAVQAQIAGNATKEITPYTITDMYIELQDWDRAKAQALRETTDDYNKGGWSKKEKEEYAASRMRDIAHAKIALANASAKAFSMKTLADATVSPAQRAQAWCDYVNAAMNTALFTDLKTTLEGLTNPGEDDPYKDATVFGNVEEQTEILVDRLKDVRDLQAKQIRFSERQP